MEAEIFEAIQTQINASVVTNNTPDFAFIHIWNNQLEKLKSKDENGNDYYNINYPALFVEFTAPNEILQLGNGVQLYDPLDIRIHIIHNEIDSMDGNLEQNINVFALKQKVFKALQGFEPSGCCAFTRVNEEQDYDHNNLYHYIQTYRTNYVDNDMTRPVNGTFVDPPIDLNISPEFDTSL
jgi:hypothetical protein